MNIRAIIIASFSLLLSLPGVSWGGPLTPEHAWRQMQGDTNRRVSVPRNRPQYRSPQIKLSKTRTTTKTRTTVVKPVQPRQPVQTVKKPVKKNGQGWLSRLKGKFKRKDSTVKDKTQTAEGSDGVAARSHKVGRVVGLAGVKLNSLWSGMVGGIRNIIALHKQRREARDVAFNTLYWRQPMIVPAGQPIPAEMLMGGMRLHKLQNYSQGTLSMLYRSGLVTATEYRILTEARMGLPQMMQQQGAPAPEGAQTAPQPEAPTSPPPPLQQ